MRILHVTDFHFRQRWYEWLASRASEYEAVCFTGDFITMYTGQHQPSSDSRPSSPSGHASPIVAPDERAQAHWVGAWLKDWPASTPLFLCSGNHDHWPQKDDFIDDDAEGGWLRKTRRPGRIWADGDQSTVINGHRFLCVTWAHKPKTETTEPVVALVHEPPAGTDVSSTARGDDGGDKTVAQAARDLPRGSFVLSGHVHEPRCWYAPVRTALNGETVWAFNPGSCATDATEPNYIVLDTTARHAECHAWGKVLSLSFPNVTD